MKGSNIMHAASVLSFLATAVGLLMAAAGVAAQPATPAPSMPPSNPPSMRSSAPSAVPPWGSVAVLVYGKAGARERRVVQAALEQTAKAAGWMLDAPASSRDQGALVVCLAAARPWPCIAPVATRRGFDRLLAVDLDRGATGELVLTGRLATAAGSAPATNQRFCLPCSDEALAARTLGLAQQLLAVSSVASGRTTLEIHTTPPGAGITLDNQMIGGLDRVLSTSPGTHTVTLQLSGYEPEVRQVTLREGEAVQLEVRFRPVSTAPHPGEGPSGPGLPDSGAAPEQDRFPRWLPVVMMSAGGLAIAAGSWISIAADPEVGTQQRRFDYSVTGLVVAGLGAAVAGGGVALWRWPPRRARPSTSAVPFPSVTLLPGGAVAGMTASF